MNQIQFPATVYKLQTLTDGGVRITLDLADDCIPQMAMLAEARRECIPLVFTAQVVGEDPQLREGTGDRPRRKR